MRARRAGEHLIAVGELARHGCEDGVLMPALARPGEVAASIRQLTSNAQSTRAQASACAITLPLGTSPDAFGGLDRPARRPKVAVDGHADAERIDIGQLVDRHRCPNLAVRSNRRCAACLAKCTRRASRASDASTPMIGRADTTITGASNALSGRGWPRRIPRPSRLRGTGQRRRNPDPNH